MREFLLAMGILLALVSVSALALVPWETSLAIGGWLVVGGFALGVPAGVVYHVELRRALAAGDGVPDDWIWRPISYHHLLTARQRRRVYPWMYAGAAGFVVISLGLLIVIVGLISGTQQV